jgi:hypothetical protein
MLPWRVRHNSARVLDSFKPDVVHFQSHLIVGGGLTKEAELRGIRIIGTNHFMPENMLQFTLFLSQPNRVLSAWFGRQPRAPLVVQKPSLPPHDELPTS